MQNPSIPQVPQFQQPQAHQFQPQQPQPQQFQPQQPQTPQFQPQQPQSQQFQPQQPQSQQFQPQQPQQFQPPRPPQPQTPFTQPAALDMSNPATFNYLGGDVKFSSNKPAHFEMEGHYHLQFTSARQFFKQNTMIRMVAIDVKVVQVIDPASRAQVGMEFSLLFSEANVHYFAADVTQALCAFGGYDPLTMTAGDRVQLAVYAMSEANPLAGKTVNARIMSRTKRGKNGTMSTNTVIEYYGLV